MEYKLFQNNLEDAKRVTKYLLVISASFLLAIFLLIVLCIAISNRNMTMLVPMNLNAPMSVSNNAVSRQYLDETALSFINLRLNFDPYSVDGNHAIILRFVSSNNYESIKKALDMEAKLVKSQGISSNFYLNNISINKHALSVLMSGTLIRSVSNKQLKPIHTQFEIDFENNNGLLLITNFFEVKNK